jgi:O-succinylhomoserine sulfhydrylase
VSASKHFETLAIRTQAERSSFKEHSVPLYLTSSFVFDDAEEMRAAFADEIERPIYSRFTNPNTDEFIEKLCLLEGCEDGVAFATGMAAVFGAFAALCKAGDHIISSRAVFGATHSVLGNMLPKWNISTTFVGLTDVAEWERALKPSTRIFYLETPTNPGVELVDLEVANSFCRAHNLLLVVDNCFATPYLQQPARFGADLVVHSATKFIDGQGRVLGGAVLGAKALIKDIRAFARSSGPALSPFNGWVLSKSLETLAVRMDRHSDNALHLAKTLEQNPKISWLRYPFLPSHPQFDVAKKQMKAGGAIVAFELKGGLASGRAFLDALQLCSRSANLGDTRTIASHPASTTHAKLSENERLEAGITPGMIRISVGIEHVNDILWDIEQALQRV